MFVFKKTVLLITLVFVVYLAGTAQAGPVGFSPMSPPMQAPVLKALGSAITQDTKDSNNQENQTKKINQEIQLQKEQEMSDAGIGLVIAVLMPMIIWFWWIPSMEQKGIKKRKKLMEGE